MGCPDIISAARRRGLFSEGDKVVAAVSGGPDSTAMLHALHTRSFEFGISLQVAHFNHALRGAESDADAEFVADFARTLGLPITVEKSQSLATVSHASEEAAREARYEFLRRVAADEAAKACGQVVKIAVGHTADDRAESVLLNLFRGTGVRGLAGIRPIQDNIVRPLIDATRKDVQAYIRAYNLPFRTDQSNQDTSYLRNWIRLELIPVIQNRCNRQVVSALVRLAELASDESDLIDRLVLSARAHAQFDSGLDAEIMLDMPRVLLTELIRSELKEIEGNLKDITYKQIEQITDALAEGGNFKIALPDGIYALRKGNVFRIVQSEPPVRLGDFEVRLTVPGQTRIEQRRIVIRAERITMPKSLRAGPDTVYVGEDSIVGDLVVRNCRPGDRIRPFGMSGTKKLQDVFTDKKVPREVRDRAIVVRDAEKILWVVGIVVSEHCRVTEKTRSIIRLSAVPD